MELGLSGGALWWSRRHVVAKALIVAASLWLAIVLLLGGAGSEFGSGSVNAAPDSTSASGYAALVSLIQQNGHKVTSDAASLVALGSPGAGTVVVTNNVLSPAENRAVARLVRSGWLLVVIGGDSLETIRPLAGSAISWTSGGPTTYFVSDNGSEDAGVGSVDTDGAGTFTDIGNATPLLGSGGETLAATAAVGAGRVDFIADSSVFANDHLADADNAAFALDVFGRSATPVTISVANQTSRSGLGVLPASWRLALLILLFAWVAWIFSIGKRLGPPDGVDDRLAAPARRSYVDSLATLLTRAKDPTPVGDELAHLFRRHLGRRVGSGLSSGEDLVRAARQAGLTEQEAATMVHTVTNERELVAVMQATEQLRVRS
jgi:hypothetical protein